MPDNRKLRNLWEQLGQQTAMLNGRIGDFNAEFQRGIEDPNYGRGTSAPSNYHMVELGVRRIVDSVEGCLAVLNDLYEEMGFDPPFPKTTRRG